jgi:CelD/BcsL family acetyltransferase involved in cellulose biosynthesis
MARFGSIAELAGWIGCDVSDLGLCDVVAQARRVTIITAASGRETYLEIDLAQVRPIVRDIRERAKEAAKAKAVSKPEPEETEDLDSWRLFKSYRPTTDGDDE